MRTASSGSAALWNSAAVNPSTDEADDGLTGRIIIVDDRNQQVHRHPSLSIASAAGCGAACPRRSRRNLLRYGKDGKLNWWIQLDFRFGRLKLCDIDGQLVGEPHEIGQRFCLHFAHYLTRQGTWVVSGLTSVGSGKQRDCALRPFFPLSAGLQGHEDVTNEALSPFAWTRSIWSERFRTNHGHGQCSRDQLK